MLRSGLAGGVESNLQRMTLELLSLRVDFLLMPDFPQPTLSEGQFRAARMLIARMLAEGEGRVFEFDEVGLQWDMPDHTIVAHYDDGTVLTVGDVMYGGIVLLWSTLIEYAALSNRSVIEAISYLGVCLAMYEPS